MDRYPDIGDHGLIGDLQTAAGLPELVDPMWLSTLDTIERELVSDSLVYRYNPSASPDGLVGHGSSATSRRRSATCR